MKALTYLRQSFPSEKPAKKIVLSSVAVGLFVSLFLMIFQPFGTSNYIKAGKTWIIWGYGFVTFLVLLLDMLFLPKIFPRIFSEAKWNLLREICFQFWHIFSIGTANIVYAHFIVKTELNIPAVLTYFFTTLSIGFFPINIGVLSSHYYLLKKYVKSAKRLTENITSGESIRKGTTKKSENIIIASETGKDKIEVNLHDLLFIKSVDNYVEVYIMRRNNIEKILLRGTLKRIEEDLKLYPFLFRCHRTYIVNVNNISKVVGNSQGYKLVFNLIDHFIPVSRDRSKKLFKIIA